MGLDSVLTEFSPDSAPLNAFDTPADTFHMFGNAALSALSLERQESVATTEARLRMEGVELKEEWQDEDFPRYCCEPFSRRCTSCFRSDQVLLTAQPLCVCTKRPLPEEEELEEELFAGTSEAEPGNQP